MTTELTRKQFDILEALATADKTFSQRDLEKHTGYSLGTVNKAIKELTDLGYIEKSKITSKGLEALEPYRAKRAVFIAAGFISFTALNGDLPKKFLSNRRSISSKKLGTYAFLVVKDNMIKPPYICGRLHAPVICFFKHYCLRIIYSLLLAL